jgi:glucan 1,4-alpha-glucosidase
MQRMKHSPLSRAIYRPVKKIESTKWSTGPKNGVGTAFYHPESGPSLSNVWFTLSSGILTEVFYPDVATPNLTALEFVVTDNQSFVDFEQTDMVHETRLLYDDALVFQQLNTARTGHYQLKKTWVTDPLAHALLLHLEFCPLSEEASWYQVGLVIDPAVSGTPMDDVVQLLDDNYSNYLAAYDERQAFVVVRSDGALFTEAACGFCGDDRDRKYTSTVETRAGPGQVWIGAKFANMPLRYGDSSACTICIGFGSSVGEALQAARKAVSQPFESIVSRYLTGWQDYLRGFHPPGCADKTQYLTSLMTMKAHEDKLHPGAVVASLATPWEPDFHFDGRLGGYHLVWPRDLCQTASTFAIAGDKSTALRILTYLDEILQLPSGSFPQNAWPDGTPNWQGCQLDQTALPILLAWQLGAANRYETLVKPAADYLVQNGPLTEQERWEENAGFSPSTLAAEIASLIVASEMARERGDFTSADIYRVIADSWEEKLETWLVTKRGKLSEAPYYIRINPSDNPDDGGVVNIKNGGGWRDKTEIVDAGFLELVRLGIRAADDPLIIHSLSVVDDAIRYEAGYGPVWKRYSYDGYGEHRNGDNYDGTGIGRPWPLLSGERGEYEIAWLVSCQTLSPRHWFGPVRLLQTLAKAANEGWMIPEQIWDGKSLVEKGLATDYGNHSATPLVWAHAEYVRLAECIRSHRVVEMPDVVYERYVGSKNRLRPDVVADYPNDVNQPLVVYPRNPVFRKGDFDLRRVAVEHLGEYVYFHIYLGHLDNPWLGPNGLSKQVIDIYLNSNQRSVIKDRELNDVKACFLDGNGYETMIRVTGNWHSDTGIYSSGGLCDRGVFVSVTPAKNVVHVVVKASSIHGVPGPGWSMAVTIAGEASGRIRPVESIATEWSFGRRFTGCYSLLTDFLVPQGENKEKYIFASKGPIIEIPMVPM